MAGEGETDGETEADGDCEGLTEALGETEDEGETDDDGDCEGLTEALGDCDGETEGLGETGAKANITASQLVSVGLVTEKFPVEVDSGRIAQANDNW